MAEEPAAAVAAAKCENGVHQRVPDHGVEIVETLGVGSGKEPVAGIDVASEFDAVPEAFEVADTLFNAFAGMGPTRGGDEADDVAPAKTGWSDGFHAGRMCDRRGGGRGVDRGSQIGGFAGSGQRWDRPCAGVKGGGWGEPVGEDGRERYVLRTGRGA